MESRQERYQREHLENVAFEEAQRRNDLEQLEREDWIKEEKTEILKAYLGNDFKLIQETDLENILEAMGEYADNVVASKYENK